MVSSPRPVLLEVQNAEKVYFCYTPRHPLISHTRHAQDSTRTTCLYTGPIAMTVPNNWSSSYENSRLSAFQVNTYSCAKASRAVCAVLSCYDELDR